jgi:plasmid stabilization system protein ParE
VALRLRITRRAAAEIERANAWWSENRLAAPHAIRIELRRALALLAMQPGIGQKVENGRLTGTRRLHLDRVRYHVYYRVTDGDLVVLAFWQSNRREPGGV